MLATHHFDHFHIWKLLCLFFLISQLLSSSKIVVTLDFFSDDKFFIQSVRIRIDILGQFDIFAFFVSGRPIFFFFYYSLTIFPCEMFLRCDFVPFDESFTKMGSLFVACRFKVLGFLHQIVNSWRMSVLFVFGKGLYRVRSWYFSLSY